MRETPFKSLAERRDRLMNLPQQFKKAYSGQKAQAERGSDVEDQEEDGDNEERAQALQAELAGQAATVSRQEDAIDGKSAAQLKRERKESEGWDTLHSGMARLAFADGRRPRLNMRSFVSATCLTRITCRFPCAPCASTQATPRCCPPKSAPRTFYEHLFGSCTGKSVLDRREV